MKTLKVVLLSSFILFSPYVIGQSLYLSKNLETQQEINKFKKSITKRKLTEAGYKTAIGDSTATLAKDTVTTKNPTSINGLGDFTFSSATMVPNINIIADITSNNIIKNGIYGRVSLYGFQKISENNLKDNAVNILIKEPSYWGVGIQGAYLVNKSDKQEYFRLGMNVNLDYTSRRISTVLKDSLPSKYIEPSSYFLKMGLEGIFSNRIGVYFNYNTTEIITGIDDFKDYFKTTSTKFNFWEFGFRGIFVTKSSGIKDTSTKIFLDFTFILLNDDLKKFTSINDKIIPMIRVNFNHPIFSN